MATIEQVRTRLAQGLVIPACPLALNSRRKLDERRQRALFRYYLAAESGGLAVGVHTTQFAIRDPKVGLFQPVLQLAIVPFDNARSRHMEAEADWMALQTTRDPAAARTLFERLTTTSHADPNPPTWSYLWDADHPTAMQRIAMVQAWARTHGSPASRALGVRPDQAAVFEILHETGLVERIQRSNAHRDRRKAPEIRHQPRVGVRRQPRLIPQLVAEVYQVPFGESALEEGAGVHTR